MERKNALPVSETEPPRSAEAGTPEELYQERRERFAEEADRLDRLSGRLSWARLVVAVAGLVSLVGSVATASGDPSHWLWATGTAAVVFGVLVVVHDRVIRRRDRWAARARLQEEALARLHRVWDRCPISDVNIPRGMAELAKDLQLTGRASVCHVLGTVQSPPGREILARWLFEPSPVDEIRVRHRSVEALVPALDLRQELTLESARLGELDPDVSPFLEWAEGEGWLGDRSHWLWVGRALPIAGWSSTVLAVVGIVPAAVPLALFAGCFLASNLLAGHLDEAHDRVAAREREMAAYAAAMKVLWSPLSQEVGGESLRRLRAEIEEEGEAPWRHLERLERLSVLADARRSGTLRFLLGTLFVWDVHTLWLLERWQRRCGSRVRGWLEGLGEIELLVGFAGLLFDEPDWSFPRIDGELDRLEAADLGHPLLSPSVRVSNDVAVGPPGSILLVTGSNMSGKSTLLRAIGVNAALARAGAPVCARELALPPVTLATSILVEDSLERGLSFFMAEVLRVRDVVRRAESAAEEGGRVLYLLDEVLRGTNSADRRVAVREVMSRLVDLGAVGAVSTHDLGIVDDPAIRQAVVPVHFRETLHPDAGPEEPVMTFDYRLRPGVAQTTNALRLLELVGIGPEGREP